jgi:hypothetical protein
MFIELTILTVIFLGLAGISAVTKSAGSFAIALLLVTPMVIGMGWL